LQSRDLKNRDKFKLHLSNCPEFLLFWMAAAKTGMVMVPTNPTSTADEMEYILAHSEARLSVTEPQYAARIHAVAARCPALNGVIEARPLEPHLSGLPSTPPPTKVAPLDEISVQYTSGTTSKPKGVLLTHANYLFGGEAMSKSMRVGPADRHLIVLPLFHAGAQVHAFIPMLLTRGSVALMEAFSAPRVVQQALRDEAPLATPFPGPRR